MAQATTLQLLPQLSFNYQSVVGGTYTGEKHPAASYYTGNKDLQTLTWNVTTVTGLITIQASLVENPNDTSDWVTVATVACNNTTQTRFQNINGNFVWLRAKVTGFTQGVIQNVKVSY